MINFYTSHCPKCNMIKFMMDSKGIEYEEIDDSDVYLPIANAHCLFSMPFADIDGTIHNLEELQKYIKNRK